MKTACMSKEQYKGIHDVVNDQGFAMLYRAISNRVSHLEVFRCDKFNTAVLESKIFQYG